MIKRMNLKPGDYLEPKSGAENTSGRNKIRKFKYPLKIEKITPCLQMLTPAYDCCKECAGRINNGICFGNTYFGYLLQKKLMDWDD